MNHSPHPAFIAWPERAALNRVLPKSKFYEHGLVSAKVRELFIRQVEQITLAFALAPSTVNLSPRDAVPEIHLLRIDLKTRELDFEVLRTIDAVWRFPTFFELAYDSETRVVAAYKRPASADRDKWLCSGYYATAWLAADTTRDALPLALDLGGLYEQLLHRLLPLPSRPGEVLTDLLERIEQVAAKRREVERTEARLAREKQFNRKVGINAVLRQLKTELDQISR